MTANVAQVFLTDDAWMATLRGVHGALAPGGHLVFEVRDPAREAWRGWNREQSYRTVDISDVGVVESWVDLTGVRDELVSFRSSSSSSRPGPAKFGDLGVPASTDMVQNIAKITRSRVRAASFAETSS